MSGLTTVILVAHILVSIILIVVVLMQRSEGGGLGIGGGGGGGGAGGGLMSGRGATSALVRTTIIFGAIFFTTSLVLTTISTRSADPRTDIERQLEEEAAGESLDDALGVDIIDAIPVPGDDPTAAGTLPTVTPEAPSGTTATPDEDPADNPLGDPE